MSLPSTLTSSMPRRTPHASPSLSSSTPVITSGTWLCVNRTPSGLLRNVTALCFSGLGLKTNSRLEFGLSSSGNAGGPVQKDKLNGRELDGRALSLESKAVSSLVQLVAVQLPKLRHLTVCEARVPHPV
eukprot:CAMPEP_0168404070 /NCGR_PEP_ID=MMETSP0228-20121227/24451_1 /TAXON_ID=133427 /ORGANISM="Protoceratium reticulatum, Strain CCCM 535 (=CCMP 1889)" /LENGTH=128 /DNA_ID=CAMNT_0008417685 /DNA_START=207 /DNA_END=589 /DNA_ORIENTATION=+